MKLAGSFHNVVYTPSLIRSIFQQRASVLCSEAINWYIIIKVFGGNRRRKKDYFAASEDRHAAVRNNLLCEPSLSKAVDTTVKAMQEGILNLVSSCRSPLDQTLWERSSFPVTCAKVRDVVESPSRVEVSLFPLIKDFVGRKCSSTPSKTEALGALKWHR